MTCMLSQLVPSAQQSILLPRCARQILIRFRRFAANGDGGPRLPKLVLSGLTEVSGTHIRQLEDAAEPLYSN
jgi:hypothetical protein